MSRPTKKPLFSVFAKDCEWSFFTVGGHGGSGKDTSNTGVRVVHPPSGAIGTARESRSQLQNRRLAFARMAKTRAFKVWAQRVAANAPSIEEQVEAAIQAEHLKVEVFRDGQWVDITREFCGLQKEGCEKCSSLGPLHGSPSNQPPPTDAMS